MVKTSDSESRNSERLNVQRWEEEGGQTVENNSLIADRPSVQLVPIRVQKHVAALQWNEKYVIEPFQPGRGIFREARNAKGKRNG